MALSAAANLTITDSGPSQAYQGYATADAFWTGALIELNLSTGLVAPLGVTGAPGAVLCGVCQEDKNITESNTTRRLDIRVDGPIIEGIAVTGVTGDSDVGRKVYCTSDDIASDATITGTSSTVPVGKIVRHISGTTCDVMLYSLREAMDMAKPGNSVGGGLVYRQVAASSAVTTTASETAFDTSTSIPANTLQVGDVIRVRAGGVATATNSTDTLTLKLKFGSTAVLTTPAVDVANSDVWALDAELTVRTIGATGTVSYWANGRGPDAGTANDVDSHNQGVISSIDTTAAITVTSTATWSTANAGNSCRQDYMTVEIVR